MQTQDYTVQMDEYRKETPLRILFAERMAKRPAIQFANISEEEYSMNAEATAAVRAYVAAVEKAIEDAQRFSPKEAYREHKRLLKSVEEDPENAPPVPSLADVEKDFWHRRIGVLRKPSRDLGLDLCKFAIPELRKYAENLDAWIRTLLESEMYFARQYSLPESQPSYFAQCLMQNYTECQNLIGKLEAYETALNYGKSSGAWPKIVPVALSVLKEFFPLPGDKENEKLSEVAEPQE